MQKQLKNVLAAFPQFSDIEAQRRAALLAHLLGISVGIGVLFMALAPFFFQLAWLIQLLLGGWVLFSGWLLAKLWQGQLRRASVLFVSGLWVVLNSFAALSGGIHGVGLFSLISVNLFAGILLGTRFATRFALLSVLSGSLILLAEYQGLLPVPHPQTASLPTWLELAVNIVVVLLVIHLTATSIEHALEEARRYAHSLAESNERLTQRTAELEAERAVSRESEERYRLFFSASHDAILIFDSESLRILETNDAALQLYGYSKQEFSQLTILDVSANPEGTMTGVQAARGLGQGELYRTTGLHCKKDGTVFPIEVSAGNVTLAGRKLIHVVVRDNTAQLQAIEKMRASEVRFRGLVEQSPYSTVIHNADGQPILTNQAFQKLWHVPDREISKDFSKFSILTDPKIQALGIKPYIERAFAGEFVEIPTMEYDTSRGTAQPGKLSPNGDGSHLRWIRAYLYPVRDAEGAIREVVLVHEDVTERKRAEDALAESENRYRAIVEGTADLICRFTPDTTLTFVNEAYCRYFGLTREDLLGRPFLELIPPDQHDSIHQHIGSLLSGGRAVTYEHQVVTPSGDIRWQQWTDQPLRNETGQIIELQSVGRDTTDRRLAEEALRKSEERYRSIVEDQTEFIVRWLPDGTRTFVNDSYCRFYGTSKETLTGSNFFDILSDADAQKIRQRVEALTAGEPVGVGYLHIHRHDGAMRWIQWSDRAIFDDSGEIVEFLSVGQDITERKIAQEELEASLKEKEILLREIHHRVKNNLQIVSSLLKLQSVSIDDQTVRNAFAESHSRIMTMALVHERLYGSNSLAQVDFASYLPDLIHQIFRTLGSANRKVRHEISVGDISLKIDKAIPCGLLVNEMVTNALKHAFPLGSQGTVRIRMERAGENYRLSVQDDGVGMKTETEFMAGESLGMQLIRTLTAQLEGTLSVSSRDGTTFLVIFPA